MKKKQKKIALLQPANETARRQIIDALQHRRRSAKELSTELGMAEKEVYDHLEHVRRSLNKPGQQLVVVPAECKKCGFEFSKRERLKKPCRCPLCKGESIHEPLFSIEERI